MNEAAGAGLPPLSPIPASYALWSWPIAHARTGHVVHLHAAGVRYGTSPNRPHCYIGSMSFKKISIVSTLWMLAIVATALVASVESPMGWLLVSVLAFGPATILLHLSRQPRTISQTIQEARR